MLADFLRNIWNPAPRRSKRKPYEDRAARRRIGKSKPPFPTLLKQSTARNLAYLHYQKLLVHGHGPINWNNLRIVEPISKRRGDGTIVRDLSPTHAV